jgi:hypothetical protein
VAEASGSSAMVGMDSMTPKSFDGRIPMTQRKGQGKDKTLMLSDNEVNVNDNLSESDDIQMQF